MPLIAVSLNQKYFSARTQSPKIEATTSSAFGPCTASGETSGSVISTFSPRSAQIARAQNRMLRIGNRQPEQVVGALEDDRVVDQRSGMVADGDIFALALDAFGQIARAQDLRQPCGIRPFQLHLPLDRDIPHRNAIDDAPIFFLRLARSRSASACCCRW